MDAVSNDILIENLKPLAAALLSEEESDLIVGKSSGVDIVFDPLDGSSNLDGNIPTAHRVSEFLCPKYIQNHEVHKKTHSVPMCSKK